MSRSDHPPDDTRPDWDEVRISMRQRLVGRMDRAEGAELEDLIQEGCVRLLRVLRREKVQDLEAMITVIAQRTFTDHLRRRYRNQRIWEPLEERHAATPAPPLVDPRFGDVLDRVEFVLHQLFARESRAECARLAESWFARRNWKDTAAELGVAHTVVRKRWSRCIEFIRAQLGKDPDFARLLGED